MKIITALIAGCLAVLAYWLVFAQSGELTVENAYVRSSGMAGAAYFEVHNGTKLPDRILSVETSAAHMADLHTNIESEDGVMQMRPLEDKVIPANTVTEFARGGKHVMLMGLTTDLKQGEKVELKIVFEQAGVVVVTAPIDNSKQ